MLVRGLVLEAGTETVPTDVVRVLVASYTDGENTGSGGGGVPVRPSANDGSFHLDMVANDQQTFCGNAPTDLEYPRPEQLVVTVQREGCEQEFTIDINEDTVVDLDFPDGVIELAEPIVLPPCEQDESGS